MIIEEIGPVEHQPKRVPSETGSYGPSAQPPREKLDMGLRVKQLLSARDYPA